VNEKETSIFSRSLSDASKLVGMKDTIFDSVKLKSLNNYLLNELAKCIKKYNGLEGLGDIIGQFTWLRNNNKN